MGPALLRSCSPLAVTGIRVNANGFTVLTAEEPAENRRNAEAKAALREAEARLDEMLILPALRISWGCLESPPEAANPR
jgi:hypothetical protein